MFIHRGITSAILLVVATSWNDTVAQQPAAAPDAVCTICPGKHVVACPTCDDVGMVEVACSHCDGKATTTCTTCAPTAKKPKTPDNLTPEERKRLEELLKLLGGLKVGEATTPKEKPHRAGRIDCAAQFCYAGIAHWDSGNVDPCKVCNGSGTRKCPDCTVGKRVCGACTGTKKLMIGCPDCRGARELACPGCRYTDLLESCPLCDGKGSGACQVCVRKAHGKTVCRDCVGTGETPCDECQGCERMVCRRCGGSGKIRSVTEGTTSSAGMTTCDVCEGPGFTKCETCRRGKIRCESCEGSKVADDPCKGTVACSCTRTHAGAGWELFGDLLARAGRPTRALELYRHALRAFERGVKLPLPQAEARRKKAESALRAKIKSTVPGTD